MVKPLATAMKVGASSGLIPNSIDSIDRAPAAAIARPIATPIAVSYKPRRMINASTCPAPAPSAMRTPISLVRCVTP